MKKIIPLLFVLTGCYYVGPNPNGPNAKFVKQPPQTIEVVPCKEEPKKVQAPQQEDETWAKVKQTAAVTMEWAYIKAKEAYEAAAKESSK